ncbi:MAG: hypothetical protein GX889_10040 [Clostridiales bacterium]|nr:hypothetical protein [Clostridiales bacterium]
MSIKNKYLPFTIIFISKLILVLISSFIVEEILSLITNSYEKTYYLIMICMLVLSGIISIFSIIAYVINYHCIKLLFGKSYFDEKISLHKFLYLSSLGSLINSVVLLLVAVVFNFIIGIEALRSNWNDISNILQIVLTFLILCSIGIYAKKKMEYKSILVSIIICLTPYTFYNCMGLIIKYFIG